jgi:sec-independent protein translocase protein TatA
MTPLFAFFGGIGLPELLIVGVIVLLLFGNRLPSVMRSLGRGVIEFKKGVQGIEEDLDEKTESKP